MWIIVENKNKVKRWQKISNNKTNKSNNNKKNKTQKKFLVKNITHIIMGLGHLKLL